MEDKERADAAVFFSVGSKEISKKKFIIILKDALF